MPQIPLHQGMKTVRLCLTLDLVAQGANARDSLLPHFTVIRMREAPIPRLGLGHLNRLPSDKPLSIRLMTQEHRAYQRELIEYAPPIIKKSTIVELH